MKCTSLAALPLMFVTSNETAPLPAALVHRVAFLPGSAAGFPWIWSQLTLAHDSLVGLGDALYLILKFAGAHRQSFDDDICTVRLVQATRFRKKQTLTNLEVVFGHLRATAAQENQAVDRVTFRPEPRAACSGGDRLQVPVCGFAATLTRFHSQIG
jgi:hypothetical protein